MVATIPLTQGQVALVDDEDYERLSKWKWHAVKRCDSTSWYARRAEGVGPGKQKLVYMHQQILGIDGSMNTDHIDGDGLNNRKVNLRACSWHQNMKNQRRPKNNSSGFKGVYQRRQKYVSQIRVDGELIHLGTFQTKEGAAQAYDEAAIEHFGEYANINFKEAI